MVPLSLPLISALPLRIRVGAVEALEHTLSGIP